MRSEDKSYYSFPFGLTADYPVVRDYDRDVSSDPAVYRRSDGNWYFAQSMAGYEVFHFGTSKDKWVGLYAATY